MRGEDQAAVGASNEELVIGALLKALVADSDDFVNQIAIEIDRQRDREIKPRPHAGGISLDRFRQIFAELCEILDAFVNQFEGPVIDPADHPIVVGGSWRRRYRRSVRPATTPISGARSCHGSAT